MSIPYPFAGTDVNFATAPFEPSSFSPDSQHGSSGLGLPGSLSPPSMPPAETRPVPAPGPLLNSRACTLCRKRKVKCDRRVPCTNCTKASAQCIFPGPQRAPRKAKKPQEVAIIQAKVAVLENLLDPESKAQYLATLRLQDSSQDFNHNGSKQSESQRNASCPESDIINSQASKAAGEQNEDVNKEFGRLEIDEGRSQYVSNKNMNALMEGLTELRDFLDPPTEDEEDYPSPGSIGSTPSTNHQGYLFGFNSTASSLRDMHPPPERAVMFWNVFKANVDPVFKFLHVPTAEQDVLHAAANLDHLSKSREAFMFSIYFSAVTSLSKDECRANFGIDRNAALQNYRFATEQAFARCKFFNSQELIVTQALLLFLVCVRHTDDSRYVWMMTGLLIRLALAQGLNRDGTRFNVRPFWTELRRRLWWQIVTLDVRASDDQGCDPTIVNQTFDTKLPLNINDEDIHPSMETTPSEREGPSEMTFDLMRFAVGATVRKLTYVPPGSTECKERSAALGLSGREEILEGLNRQIQDQYLKHCDTERNPLHWVIGTVSKIIVARLWLIVHHRTQSRNDGKPLPADINDRCFRTAIEVLRFSKLLQTDRRTRQWSWMFKTYVQWHSLFVIVSQLCVRTSGPEVDIAWATIDSVTEDWDGFVNGTTRGMMFKPLRNAIVRARKARAKALQQQARFPHNGFLGPATNSNILPPDQFVTASLPEEAIIPTFDAAMSTSTRDSSLSGMDENPALFAGSLSEQDLQAERLKQNVENWWYAPVGTSIMPEDNLAGGWVDMPTEVSMGQNIFLPNNSGTSTTNGANSNGFANWY